MTYTEGGNYTDTMRTVGGCDSIIGLVLTKLNAPTVDITSSYSCADRSHTLVVHSNMPYIYWNASNEDTTLDGQEHNDTIVVVPTRQTIYTVYADYHNHLLCPATASINVSPIVVPTAAVQLMPSFVTVEKRQVFAIDSSLNSTSRRWYVDGVELSNTEERISYTVDQQLDSIQLTLVATNDMCADTTTVTVPTFFAAVYAPNVFTPSEEINTHFKVSIPTVENFEINIYSRQGLLVYHSTNPEEAWDGTHNGTRCQQAAYVYTVHYTDRARPGTWQSYSGTVLLLR